MTATSTAARIGTAAHAAFLGLVRCNPIYAGEIVASAIDARHNDALPGAENLTGQAAHSSFSAGRVSCLFAGVSGYVCPAVVPRFYVNAMDHSFALPLAA